VRSICQNASLYNGNLYYAVLDTYYWSEAYNYSQLENCCGVAGHVVTIANDAENTFVFNYATSAGVDENYWIGLTDLDSNGVFTWITNEPVSYTNWLPALSSGGEVAVGIYDNNGLWDQVPASFGLPYIVEFDCPQRKA
jgi:hypothetical protein